MTGVKKPTSATATLREPILICCDDCPDSMRAIEAAVSLLDPLLVVPPPR
jgi:hypothetical protein